MKLKLPTVACWMLTVARCTLQAVVKWVRQLIADPLLGWLQTMLINRTLHTFQRNRYLILIKYEQYSLTSAGWLCIRCMLLSVSLLLSLSLSLPVFVLCWAALLPHLISCRQRGNADALTRAIMLISPRWVAGSEAWRDVVMEWDSQMRMLVQRAMLFNCSLMFIAACKFTSSLTVSPFPFPFPSQQLQFSLSKLYLDLHWQRYVDLSAFI